MLHQNPKILSAVVISAKLSKTLTILALTAMLVITAAGLFTEANSILAGPQTRIAGAFHLFGAHNNFTGWYQSTAFGIVAFLLLCMSANVDGQAKVGFVIGSAAMIYMSSGELTNWDHGNWARLAASVAPADMGHFVMSGIGVTGAVLVALWAKIMLRRRALFLLALAVYSVGAFGFDAISTEITIRSGSAVSYIVSSSIEEILEMTGCFLLFVAIIGFSNPPEEFTIKQTPINVA